MTRTFTPPFRVERRLPKQESPWSPGGVYNWKVLDANGATVSGHIDEANAISKCALLNHAAAIRAEGDAMVGASMGQKERQ